MKVNGMMIFVIKLATICLCINNVLSATLSDGQSIEGSETTTLAPTTTTTISAVEASTITEEDYDNVSQEKSSTSEAQDTKQPPLVFPSDDKTETSKNSTALEILQKNSNASTMENKAVTDSPSTTSNNNDNDNDGDVKVDDSDKEEEVGNDKSSETSEQPQQQQSTQKTENDYDNVNDEEENEKNDVENFQDDKEQGYLEEQFGFNSTSINPFDEPATLKGGHIAVIFASLLIVLSVTAYLGLVLWRNRLESRYGMRQRLVTEDDYYNNNDVRFFGL